MTQLITRDQFEPIIQAVTNAVDSEHTKRQYAESLRDFFRWYQETGQPTLNRATVQRYKADMQEQGLNAGNVNRRLSAIRKLAEEAEYNGALPSAVANGIKSVRGVRQEGRRAGNWLTLRQAQNLINKPNTASLKGLRDRAILATLIGCGLRREEAASLTHEHVQQRDGRWVIVDLVGKRNKIRTIPMPSWAKSAIDAWSEAAGVDSGCVFLPMNKGGRITGTEMSPQALYYVVREYTDVSPHDLRRTYAKLARQGGAELSQIQLSLGHSSVKTTQNYIGEDQDLTNAPCDHIKIKV